MEKSVISLLIDAQKLQLIDHLLTNVSDDSKVGSVVEGAMRESPVDTRINLYVRPGDDKWRHVINAEGKGMKMPTYEIGGGSGVGGVFWRRRFIIEVKIYLDGEGDRVVAQQIAHTVLSRAEHTITLMSKANDPAHYLPPKDDFGEQATWSQVVTSYLEEGGDSGFPIWRGEIYTEFFTEKL